MSILLFGADYINKVKSVERQNLIGYWPMNEPTGAVAVDHSKELNNGAYTGVTLGQPGIGDGKTCPFFDGTNDFNNIYSAAFNVDFNGREGSCLVWAKGDWTGTALRYLIGLRHSGTNAISIIKTSISGRVDFTYIADSTTDTVALTGLTGSGWRVFALTWSLSAGSGELKAYVGGSQTGSTQTGLGTHNNTLGSTVATIGSANTTPASVWDGTLAHVPVWKTPLSAAQISNLAVV